MKLAILLPHALRGGIERICLNLINELHGEIDVTLLVYGRLPPSMPLPKQVSVHNLKPGRKLPYGNSRWLRTIFALPALRSYIKKERPDVMLSFQAPLLAALATVTTRKSAAFVARESNSLQALRGNYLQVRLKRWLKRFAYGRAETVIALCNEMAEELAQFGIKRAKIETIYNPTVTDAALKLPHPPPDHDWFKTDRTVPVITSSGRLDQQKDHNTLIRAFSIVAGERPCRLVLMGSGHLRDKLNELVAQLGIQDRVWLVPYVDEPYRYVANSSMFVQASIYEGLSNAIIEAQACGVPVVSTACPTSPREILMDGRAGTLVPMRDPAAMAAAILNYLHKPELCRQHVDVATRNVGRFEARKNSRKYLQLLQKVSKSR